MYICKNCNYEFEKPKKYSEDRTPGCAFEGGTFIEYFTGCPLCAGGYEETAECNYCERTFAESDLIKDDNNKLICRECYLEKEEEDGPTT